MDDLPDPSPRPVPAAAPHDRTPDPAHRAFRPSDESTDTTGPSWGRWASAGIDFGVAVAVFFFLGSWLDAKWSTAPWMRVAGAGFGVVVGMYLLIRKAITSFSSESKSTPKGRFEPPRDPAPPTP